MVELIYPVDSAKLYKGSKFVRSVEMFPVCDRQGNVLWQAPRDFCHKNRLLHPVVHLNIVTRRGSIALQRRSADKDTWPLRWDFVSAGHVIYGEEILESLRREASEEIGLTDFNPVHIASYVFEDENEQELVNSFAAVGDFEYHPDHEEVSDVKLWSIGEIQAEIGKGTFTPNFEYEFPLISEKLLALL